MTASAYPSPTSPPHPLLNYTFQFFTYSKCHDHLQDVCVYVGIVTVVGKLLKFERQFCIYLKAFICELEQSKVSLCTSPTFA